MSRLNTPVLNHAAALFMAALFVCVSGQAFAAQTLGDMTNNFYDSLIRLQGLLSLLSYILGIFFSITGIQQLRDHVDSPAKNPIMKPLLRMAAAAFFIFAPHFANLLVNSISGAGSNEYQLQFTNKAAGSSGASATSDGLDAALTNFVGPFAKAMLDNLLPFLSYVSGVILMMVGLKRLALSSGDGPQAPGGMGTIGTFVVAAGLMAFGYVMYILQGSIFGETTLVSNPVFKDAQSTDMSQRANDAMWGVFIFLRIVGYISVLRGLFQLREVAEGKNASMVSVMTHMIAGACLANGTAFVLAMQSTFIKDSSNYILQ